MSAKVKVSVQFADTWVNGGQSISEIRVRALQNGSELMSKTVAYTQGQPVVAEFGADLPNGDTTFVARAFDANGAPVGGEVSTSMNVDKTLIQAPASVSAE
jgi:hypothetical protein